VDIKFFYQNNQRSKQHEVIITSFANLISTIIELPSELEVCLYPLEENVYGGIDVNRVNRIGLNIKIPYMDIPKILTHELIHVNQKHLGLLRIDQRGMCYWRGIPYTKKDPDEMSYEEYINLPWEVDVQNRQSQLLSEALRLYNSKT
jgi:hypothetical protein